MNAAIRGPTLLHAGFCRGNNAARKAHAPGKFGGHSVVTIAAEEATDSANSVTHAGGRAARVKKCERRNFFPLTQE